MAKAPKETKKSEPGTLKVVKNAIEKEYGPLIKWLGEAASETPEVLSTGCIGLDHAIGCGGLERGLIAEFFGPEASGKSFLAYSVIKEACAIGHKCVIIDAEHTMHPRLLVKLGLPEDRVLIVDGAPTGEQNLSISQKLMETGEFAVVLIDSVAALLPDQRADADFSQQTMGLHARLMSAGLQKLVPVVKKTNTLLIFVNQIRFKIGGYGNPETTTGGNALLYYAGYRIYVAGGKSKSSRLLDKGTGEVYGHRTSFRIDKNKRSAPFRTAEVDLVYGMGYDTLGEIVDLGVDVGLIEQGGAWLAYNEHKWQGRDKAKLALQKDEELKDELERQIRAIVSGEIFEIPTPPEGPPNLIISEDGKVKEKNDKPARKKRAANAETSVS